LDTNRHTATDGSLQFIEGIMNCTLDTLLYAG